MESTTTPKFRYLSKRELFFTEWSFSIFDLKGGGEVDLGCRDTSVYYFPYSVFKKCATGANIGTVQVGASIF